MLNLETRSREDEHETDNEGNPVECVLIGCGFVGFSQIHNGEEKVHQNNDSDEDPFLGSSRSQKDLPEKIEIMEENLSL